MREKKEQQLQISSPREVPFECCERLWDCVGPPSLSGTPVYTLGPGMMLQGLWLKVTLQALAPEIPQFLLPRLLQALSSMPLGIPGSVLPQDFCTCWPLCLKFSLILSTRLTPVLSLGSGYRHFLRKTPPGDTSNSNN